MAVFICCLILPLLVCLGAAELEVFRSNCLKTGLFQASEKDRALARHKLDTYVVKDQLDCGIRCLGREGCISYNYQYAVISKGHKCELNSQTKEAKPEDYEEKHGFQYFGSLREREDGAGCGKYTCYKGGSCVDTCHGDMFYCQCTKMFLGKQCERTQARNCKELLELGDTSDGIKQIAPDDDAQGITVYCDQSNDGGGWTLIQRRSNPFNLFSKNWAEYEQGFGYVGSSFWLGNKFLSPLTTTRLRIEGGANGGRYYGVYENFSVSGPEDNYRLSIGRYALGNIGDAIHGTGRSDTEQNGMQFTTSNRDNDRNSVGNGANVSGPSGWWFSDCGLANLNQAMTPQWDILGYALASSEMKIRSM